MRRSRKKSSDLCKALRRIGRNIGDVIAPLIDFCLPEGMLIAWERTRSLKETSDEYRSYGKPDVLFKTRNAEQGNEYAPTERVLRESFHQEKKSL
ncbi:hypothetical protein NPIL_282781 [Nephila pilipes]|uniref:Uncharacterized protein n=1 Tax=Nephila pilipes TaxID=299642 RepID=A0A8X6MTG4_NEPPI|nr:hypothetical protein NPIL_52481 [Nephila pilipes]GFU55312.1 hypothetical protein NPIL_282781 [Nephila pilipes]